MTYNPDGEYFDPDLLPRCADVECRSYGSCHEWCPRYMTEEEVEHIVDTYPGY